MYSCSHCGKTFSKAQLQSAHERCHDTPVSPFHCSICEINYSSKDNLFRHKKREHDELNVKRSCLEVK